MAKKDLAILDQETSHDLMDTADVAIVHSVSIAAHSTGDP